MPQLRSNDSWIVCCAECVGPDVLCIWMTSYRLESLYRRHWGVWRKCDFGLQLNAKKCTFLQTEVAFLGHIVGRTGLACDPEKLSAVRNWHEPNRVKVVRQFVGFIGHYRRFVKIFAELADPLVALTRKGVPFMWGDEQQTAFDALKACLLSAPILGFPRKRTGLYWTRMPVYLQSEVFLVRFKMKRKWWLLTPVVASELHSADIVPLVEKC